MEHEALRPGEVMVWGLEEKGRGARASRCAPKIKRRSGAGSGPGGSPGVGDDAQAVGGPQGDARFDLHREAGLHLETVALEDGGHDDQGVNLREPIANTHPLTAAEGEVGVARLLALALG